MTDSEQGSRFSLRFLSGKCQGSEYALADMSDTVVGRSAEADLVLLEGMVSRLHARFRVDAERELSVEDLGSTNGTFVNGDRVNRRELVEGDRVLIGTSILKVVSSSGAGAKGIGPLLLSQSMAGAPTRSGDDISGSLDEITVLELVEMYGVPERQAIIELDTTDGAASLTLSGGRVQACRVTALPNDASMAKRTFRFLSIEGGSFRVLPYAPPDELTDGSVAELLVEGRHLLNEFTLLMARLPGAEQQLVLARPLVRKLSELDEVELDLLQLAHNTGKLRMILDQWHETDVHAARRLLTLLDGGFLRRR